MMKGNKVCGYSRRIYKTMIRTLLLLFTIFVLTSNFAYADNGGTIVHVTNTGECYHRAGCSYLRSDNEITLREAVEKGYRACSRCNPPRLETLSSNANTKTSSYSAKAVNNSNSGMGWFVVVGAVVIYIGFRTKDLASRIKENKEKAEQRAIAEAKARAEWEAKREYYRELYEGKNPLSLVQVPEGVFFVDGYPSTKGKRKYGKYTVYVARKSGRVMHFNPNCGGATLIPVNYVERCRMPHCQRCGYGKMELPDVDWYFEYRKIKEIKAKYHIE